MLNPRRFVLLDRDGTIIHDKHYLADPDGVELIAGAAQGMRVLRDLGFGIVVVTNQSGIGRGFFTIEAQHRIHERMCALLAEEGVGVDGIYICPHTPEQDCTCRKPLPGLAEQALKDHGFDPETAIVIGDKRADIELGKAIGALSILVRTGKGAAEEAKGKAGAADHIVDDLAAAARLIAGSL